MESLSPPELVDFFVVIFQIFLLDFAALANTNYLPTKCRTKV